MSGYSNVSYYFPDIREFRKLLEQAAKSAETDWQINFVSSIEDAFDKWAGKARLSQKQYDQLVEIAGW